MNPYVEICLRAIAVYAFIIIAIRIFGKKELAQLSVIDLVFILLISNAVQNAMVGPDTSLAGGIVAALVLFIVNFLLKKVLFTNEKLSHLLQGQAILLIYNGKVQSENMHHAEITLFELEAAVREHGVKDIQNVDLAMLEVDGNISVVSNDLQRTTSHILTNKKHKFRGRVNKI
jgi:uncharacterized membrane protein YcaP (DUF421 family)